ncbi:MAG TPA: UDP-2,3-diacylglucosamine diphosphatase LpxI [Pseudolabrys sp.]|nr:UDP-2,3-diacylglucosamine diphosphatase LpxI [Pseudolabrys sp.]
MTGDDMQGPLGIVSGGGTLPFEVADAAIARGRKVLLFPIKGAADPQRAKSYPHRWIGVTQGRTLMRLMRKEGCRDVVLIGSLNRPSPWQILLSLHDILSMLPTLMGALRRGDNHLLSVVARFAERNGFHIIGAHEVAPEILVKKGSLTARQPSDIQRTSIDRGLALLNAIGSYDVGQGAVVINQNIVAVEGIEGTDAMLARVRDLRRSGRVATMAGEGVLVKAPKPQQDRRFDLPAIGPKTVRGVAEAGLAGLAVVAGQTVIAEPEELLREADRLKVFVVAVEAMA